MVSTIRGLDEILRFAAIPPLTEPERMLESAGLLQRVRAAIRRTLAATHLVDVACELAERRRWPLSTLGALGVPVDLLDCFPQWRRGSRTPFAPGLNDLRLAPVGAARPLGTLRLQLSPMPGTIPFALRLLRDLVRRVDRTTRFVVVVEPGADLDALSKVAGRLEAGAQTRIRFVPLRTISVFAQDNARAARDAQGRPVLLVPRSFRATGARADDEMDPSVAERAFGVPVRRSRLYWEGGNVVHDDDRCFVGADTLAENTGRLGLTRDELIDLFEVEFGMPVAVLGRAGVARYDADADRLSASGQASFHLDLDVAMLGRIGRARNPRALVADAARGLDFVDDVLAERGLVTGHFLPPSDIRRHVRAEYEAYATTRHPLLLEYAATLGDHGYGVVGVPDLRVDPDMDVFRRVNLDFGYCNVLPGSRKGRPAVHHFVSGIGALDADASRCMRLAGVDSVPVSTPDVASALMLLYGGLHCCCGTI
jgi:hypothetical protein